jgi:hypothetical protein
MKFLKFLLVNGRTPCLASTCAWCCEPIGEAYLREVPTRLPYCDQRCYFAHLQSLEDFHAAKADEAVMASPTIQALIPSADQAAAAAGVVQSSHEKNDAT